MNFSRTLFPDDGFGVVSANAIVFIENTVKNIGREMLLFSFQTNDAVKLFIMQ